jgi:hypothetical protein
MSYSSVNFFAVAGFSIFCIRKVFSGAIQQAKFEHRSSDKNKEI